MFLHIAFLEQCDWAEVIRRDEMTPLYLVPIALCTVFALMILAAYLCYKCRDLPECYGSNPDPLRQGYLRCRDCVEKEECLK